jgi:hypothetical protein
MKKFMFALLLLAGCTATLQDTSVTEPDDDARSRQTQGQESSLIPGSMIIEVTDELADQLAAGSLQTKSSSVNAAFEALDVMKIERVFPDAGEFEPRHRAAGLHRFFRVTYNPESVSATKAAVDFSGLDGVLSANPARRIRSEAYFNDPYASKQWALYNDGNVIGGRAEAGCDINVQPVWSAFTGGSSNVTVAVVDGGVQMDHPDLSAVMVPAGDSGSWSFVYDHEGATINPTDHGTHVAGAIGAVSNNGVGISGIAGGLDGKGGVRILSCAVFMKNPSNPDKEIWGDPAEAMVYAADHGALLANNSWGYVYDSEEEALNDGIYSDDKAAVDYFTRYAGCDKDGNQRADSPMKGGLVIFSAGNDGWKMGWPAAYEGVVAVAATNARFSGATYTNYGSWVDICAPGGQTSEGVPIISTVSGGVYGNMQGTSMAAPQVTGVAALIVSYFGGPGFTSDELREMLLEGASKTKVSQDLLIGPMVDAMGSFSYGDKEAPEPASNVSVRAQANSLVLSWKVTSDPPRDGKAEGYIAVAAKDASALAGLDPKNIPASVKQVTVEVGTRAVGDAISATLTDLEFNTQYAVAVIAYDNAGNYSALSTIQTASTAKNNPPVVKTDYKGDYRVKPFEKLAVEYTVSDPDGHDFTIEVAPGSEAMTYTVKKDVVSVVIAGNVAPHGKYTARIVATDQYGETTDYPIDYEILENHAPKVINGLANQIYTTTGKSESFDLTQLIQDEDGEPLSYSFSLTEPDVINLNASSDKLVLTTRNYGLTTATVTATDACKASCSFTFSVLIRDASRPVDLYPNPVVDKLNIRPGQDDQLEVTVTNKVGATVWSGTAAAGPFNSLSVDLSAQPGGVYYVHVKGASVDDNYTIAKK